MRKYLQKKVFELCYYLELVISFILIITITILSIKLIMNVSNIAFLNQDDALNDFMSRAMALAIGVEFIKMLCKHTPNTVIEVLLFAIARQLIVGHGSSFDMIIGIIAIVMLFATRKYLLCSFDETEKSLYRASQNVKLVNMLSKISIPDKDGKTLRDVITNKLTQEEKTIAVGSCVYYKEFALRIDHMHGENITRVEVIKSI